MPDKEKEQVIKAIGELGRRVTAADVATKTGLSFLLVQQKLNQIASEVGGNLQVGSSGDIVYNFTPGFTNTYLAKGLTAVLLVVGAKLLQVLFYMLRISFGVALILSLVIVVVLIIALTIIMSKGLSDDRGDRDDNFLGGLDFGGGGGFHFSFWDWMVLRDLLWWNSMTTSQPIGYRYDRPTIRRRTRSNFLLNCFSFLFGDGDPNEGLEEKRWQLIAQVIKRNNHVVTAEQLAPYTGIDPKDQAGALSVLVRFNGRPEVTASGNIVYVFESLHSIASDQKTNPPSCLEEFPWKFTNVPEGELVPVYIVAGLNLAGSLVLFNWTHSQAMALKLAAWGLAGPIGSLIPVLCTYGALFVSVPLVRILINNLRNHRIEERNIKRQNYAQMVAAPDKELAAKLNEARTYQISDKHIGKEDVVYTTEKDSLDQADELSDKFKGMESGANLHVHSKSPTGSDKSAASTSQPDSQPDGPPDTGVKIKLPKQGEKLDASP